MSKSSLTLEKALADPEQPDINKSLKKKKSPQAINAGEGEKREPSYTVDGNVNSCSHYGEKYGGALTN